MTITYNARFHFAVLWIWLLLHLLFLYNIFSRVFLGLKVFVAIIQILVVLTVLNGWTNLAHCRIVYVEVTVESYLLTYISLAAKLLRIPIVVNTLYMILLDYSFNVVLLLESHKVGRGLSRQWLIFICSTLKGSFF